MIAHHYEAEQKENACKMPKSITNFLDGFHNGGSFLPRGPTKPMVLISICIPGAQYKTGGWSVVLPQLLFEEIDSDGLFVAVGENASAIALNHA